MTRRVRTIWPTASLKEAAFHLREFRLSGLPVVDAEGKLLGVVSQSDLLRADAASPQRAPRSVADVMSAPALVTGPEVSLADAERVMVARDVTRLPVLSAGRLVGVVSRSDVVAALAVPDAELVAAARAILARQPLERSGVSVAVSGGRVRLGGALATRRQAEFLVHEVSLVPGVRAVLPELTWETDDSPGA
jgi:predicted transcriptional regulator